MIYSVTNLFAGLAERIKQLKFNDKLQNNYCIVNQYVGHLYSLVVENRKLVTQAKWDELYSFENLIRPRFIKA